MNFMHAQHSCALKKINVFSGLLFNEVNVKRLFYICESPVTYELWYGLMRLVLPKLYDLTFYLTHIY